MSKVMDEKTWAYVQAKAAAEADFESALHGLLAGHAAKIERINAERAEIDIAFLSALVLTGKGARLDPEGTLAQTICKGLRKRSGLSKVESDFLAETEKNTP